MKKLDPLALLAHKVAPNQFDICQGFTYISIRDQMNRAAMVVDALVDSGLVSPGTAKQVTGVANPNRSLQVDLVIFGAGAAGLAAAMAAKAKKLSFALVERGPDIPGGVLQSQAERYVSVSMYEWPNVSSTMHDYPVAHPQVINTSASAFSLSLPSPVLIADFANAVKAATSTDINAWIAQGNAMTNSGNAVGNAPRLAFVNATATDKTKRMLAGMLTRIVHIKPRIKHAPMHIAFEVSPPNFTGGPKRSVALNTRVVLYATGFEPETKYLDRKELLLHEDNQPFWEPDDFDEEFAGRMKPPRVLIQGSGDGALQDLFRMCVKRNSACNDPLRAWEKLESEARLLATKAPPISASDFDFALARAKAAFSDREVYTTGHLAWRRSVEAYRQLDTEIRQLIQAWRNCPSLHYMFKAFEKMRREDISSVTLMRSPSYGPGNVDWSCFEKCYLLNRVWAWFLFEANAFELMNGVAAKFARRQKSSVTYRYVAKEVVEVLPGNATNWVGVFTKRFDIVILRAGTRKAKEKGQHLGFFPQQITRLDLTRIVPPIRT